MRWKQIMFLFLSIALPIACSRLELPEQTPSAPATGPTALSPIGPVSPDLRLEWSEKLPMGWRAEQALVVQNVVYFSNFGLTTGGLSEATPIIAAFDLNTRELLWRIEQEPLIPMASDGERLFVLTDSGIMAISLTDGSTLWQTTIVFKDSYYDELLVGGEWVFYNDNRTSASELYALNTQTGTIVWTTSLAAPTDWFKPHVSRSVWDEYRAMTYDRGTLYVRVILDIWGTEEKFRFMLIALDAKDGRRLWGFPFETPATQGDAPPVAASRPAFSEQAVYFGAFGGISYALHRETGEVLWEHAVQVDRPVYVNDQIITISDSQIVAALDAQTGDLKWTVPFMDNGIGMLSSFIFSNEHLIFYASDGDRGQLSVVNIESGEVVFTLHPDFPRDCSPLFPVASAVHGEHLYLVTLNCIHSFQASWEE